MQDLVFNVLSLGVRALISDIAANHLSSFDTEFSKVENVPVSAPRAPKGVVAVVEDVIPVVDISSKINGELVEVFMQLM